MQFRRLSSLPLLICAVAIAQQTEMDTKEAPIQFTSRVNLVPVTVVVRDRDGHAVGNLTRDDFRVLDNGKPQVIARFSVEKPGEPAAVQKEPGDLEPREEKPSGTAAGTDAPAPLASHFVAYLFDDVHVQPEEIMRARDAAARVIATSMQPTDRAAIYTTSGQIVLEFTSDQAKLHETLARLRPVSGSGGIGHGMDCPDINYFMADRIVNMNDPQAIAVALIDFQACSANPYATANQITLFAERALHDGERQTKLAAGMLAQVVRRLAAMPGQRNLLLASPGFFVPFADQVDIANVINRAIRANVIVSTLDVRGLWTPPGYDPARGTTAGPQSRMITAMNQYMEQEAAANELVMEDLAHSTGGDWFHANNDLGDGFRRLATAPEFLYVLAFTPEILKSDGKYHKLQVALREPKGLTLQARKGYYAPRPETAAGDMAKQEIEDAVFSREVIKDIPLAVRTQFFRSGGADASLSVVAQLDIKGLHYRKAEGRNQDTLTVIAVLFDLNGNYVAGEKRDLNMRLKDETLEKKLDGGIRVKVPFNVKVGSYVVRVVVRDSEGQMMASENTAVEIQ